MLVDKCDVRQIPHFIPLVDLGGVVYPVRIILEIDDVCIDEEVSAENCAFHARVSDGRRRPYAEVTASNREAKRVKHCWKAVSPSHVVSDISSRVSETLVLENNGDSNRQPSIQCYSLEQACCAAAPPATVQLTDINVIGHFSHELGPAVDVFESQCN